MTAMSSFNIDGLLAGAPINGSALPDTQQWGYHRERVAQPTKAFAFYDWHPTMADNRLAGAYQYTPGFPAYNGASEKLMPQKHLMENQPSYVAPFGFFDLIHGSARSTVTIGQVPIPEKAGTIDGYTTDENSVPIVRKVRVHDRQSGDLLRETWSDTTGYYRFHDLNTGQLFTVVGHDYTGTYNAVIADNVQPEYTP